MSGAKGGRLPVASYQLPVTAGPVWQLVTGNWKLSRLPAARLAVATGFFLSGLGFASWVVRIPEVQAGLGLSKGVLGLVLLGVAAGALVAMPLSGAVIARWGSRSVLRAAALAFALSVALPPLAPGAWTLGLCLVLLGGSNSVMSVAMNTQAAAIERRYRRPIMASFHALYSFGGLAGATLGGLMAGAGVAPGPHLGAFALAIAAAALLVAPATLPHVLEGGGGGRSFARPTRHLVALGAVAV
jgi:MFS family permease